MQTEPAPQKLRKHERRERIVMELRLRPHVRVSDLSRMFAVSAETVRRDLARLSADGVLDLAHGGASARTPGRYPTLHERDCERREERERIGQRAAHLVNPGETLMIDSGSTTLQVARFLAIDRIPCTAITNSFPVAMALGQGENIDVIVCPGEYLPEESAVTGTDTTDFLARHNVDRCFIGASGLTREGPSETVRGFAAVKRAMLHQSGFSHLLIDGDKFERTGLSRIGQLSDLTSVVSDCAPPERLGEALSRANVEVLIAEPDQSLHAAQ
ncbi:DeoR/GlpR family DNA-binding transcription regulator [Oceaniglobus indicus]|uniref:DeoR/GlpR family DNA-binding transcription regulator n=1 Tax=Oceaniglobus indicus TaxID=2047749 RepID=UPI001F4EA5FB|nr:DeoR/GlpR family DNA-binding transcription regulator [Oceaniglobus indicus]